MKTIFKGCYTFLLNPIGVCIFLIVFCCSMSYSSSLKYNKLSYRSHRIYDSNKAIENSLNTFVFSSDEKTLYIINGKSDNSCFLHIINTDSGKILKKIPLEAHPIQPRSIAITPDNKKIYVAAGYGYILSINLETEVLTNIQMKQHNSVSSLNISPDGTTLFAAEEMAYPGNKTGIYTINIQSDRIISYIDKQFSPLHYGFMDAALSIDGSKLYLIDLSGKALSILDTQSLHLYEHVLSYKNWDPYAIIPDNHEHLYFPSFDNNSLFIVNSKNYKMINQLPTGRHPWDGVIAAEKLYISNSDSNDVSIINISNKQVIKTIPVGSHPFTMRASRDGKKVYVGNSNDFSISVINTVTDEVVETLHLENTLKQ